VQLKVSTVIYKKWHPQVEQNKAFTCK
jgi:hypothetical protein